MIQPRLCASPCPHSQRVLSWHKLWPDTRSLAKNISSSTKIITNPFRKILFWKKKKGIKKSNRTTIRPKSSTIFFHSPPTTSQTYKKKKNTSFWIFDQTPPKNLPNFNIFQPLQQISGTSIWLRSWSLSRSYLANNSSRSFVFCRAEARRTACSLAPHDGRMTQQRVGSFWYIWKWW